MSKTNSHAQQLTEQVTQEEHIAEALTGSTVAALRDYSKLVRTVEVCNVVLRSLTVLDEDIRPWIKAASSLIAAEALKVEVE